MVWSGLEIIVVLKSCVRCRLDECDDVAAQIHYVA